MSIVSFPSFGPGLTPPTSRMPASPSHTFRGPARRSGSPVCRPLGYGDRQSAPVAASALAPFRLPDFDCRVLGDEFLGNERDPHAPSGVHAEQPTELRQRQLLVVDTDDDFPVRPTVVDEAAEHVPARDPLIAVLVIVDLLL